MADMPQNYSICVVCSGNICRSPIGEAILRDEIRKAGLEDRVTVCSAGTGGWHVGEAADHRAAHVARSHGLDIADHRAEVFDADHLEEVDLVLAFDSGHVEALRRLARDDADLDKIRLLRSFDPESVADDDLEVADPYYGDKRDFEIAYQQVAAAAPGVIAYVREQLSTQPA